MLIQFIPGKWISTKSIIDNIITVHCTVPDNFLASEYINKPLVLSIKNASMREPMLCDCVLSDVGASYYYSPGHDTYAIKLDIVLPDLLLIWYVLTSSLDLTIEGSKQ